MAIVIDNTPDGDLLITSPVAGSVTIGDDEGGGGGNSFTTIQVAGQSDVVAESATDTLTLVAGTNITLTTDAGTDTITITAGGGGADPEGWVAIETIEWASPLAAVDIALLPATYQHIRIVGNIAGAAAGGGNNLFLTASADNGATFMATGYRYTTNVYQTGAAISTSNNTAGTTGIAFGIANAQGTPMFIDITIRGDNNATLTPQFGLIGKLEILDRANNTVGDSLWQIGSFAHRDSVAQHTHVRIRNQNGGHAMPAGKLFVMGRTI